MDASEARKLSDLFNQQFDIAYALNNVYERIKEAAESGATEIPADWEEHSVGVRRRFIDELELNGYKVFTRPCFSLPNREHFTRFTICWSDCHIDPFDLATNLKPPDKSS